MRVVIRLKGNFPAINTAYLTELNSRHDKMKISREGSLVIINGDRDVLWDNGVGDLIQMLRRSMDYDTCELESVYAEDAYIHWYETNIDFLLARGGYSNLFVWLGAQEDIVHGIKRLEAACTDKQHKFVQVFRAMNMPAARSSAEYGSEVTRHADSLRRLIAAKSKKETAVA